jgi:hypothetical protein
MKHDGRTLLDAFASQNMEIIADYVRRGRTYAGLSDQELGGQWKTAFRHMSAAPESLEALTLHDELVAEFTLRGKNPPVSEIAEEVARSRAAVFRRILDADPETRAAMREEFERVIEELDDRHGSPKN